MHRRDFLCLTTGAALGVGSGAAKATAPTATRTAESTALPIALLREKYRHDLFVRFLPFWEAHGIDHEQGGFICGLDHDGTRVSTDKHHWFQGRGIWVWSYLYNHFGRQPAHRAVAENARTFLRRHAPSSDHGWPALWARDGRVLKPFSGDTYGMLFAAEGFQEYAAATGDEAAREEAFRLFFQVFADLDRPDFRFFGGAPGVRAAGQWFIQLQVATQLLQRWPDPRVATIADRCLEAVMARHHNPEIDLTTEMRAHDFSSPPGEERKVLLGHIIEAMWIVMVEARRRQDTGLYHEAARRLRRHFEVAWDNVYGGLAEWINVGAGGFEWPVERPTATTLEFRYTGEFNYMKSLWALDEALIGLLDIYEHTGAPWAAEYFLKTHRHLEAKYSLEPHGHLPWLCFLDREGTYQPRGSRQDNYHHPRQLMFNLRALERLTITSP